MNIYKATCTIKIIMWYLCDSAVRATECQSIRQGFELTAFTLFVLRLSDKTLKGVGPLFLVPMTVKYPTHTGKCVTCRGHTEWVVVSVSNLLVVALSRGQSCASEAPGRHAVCTTAMP